MAKKALLVGLNRYPDPANSLHGCLNDVEQVAELLEDHLWFHFHDIAKLTDSEATTARIIAKLRWLLDGASAGDVLLFHYSGHGSQVADRNGDELDDRLDEIICPYDLDWNRPFTDDDLGAIVKDLPAGVNLTVVLDCCHSGTGLREFGPPPQDPHRARFLDPPGQPRTKRPDPRELRRFGARAVERGAILIAACRSNQVAADAAIDGSYHGALTYYLCQALAASGYSGSYTALVQRVKRLLRENGFDQVPQLEGPAGLLRHPVFASPIEQSIG